MNSVLSQDFLDFEFVISDNSDDESTYNVVRTLSDSRIKYYRTGSLSMVDNWNKGYSQASGHYLLLIEDKYYMKPHVLSLLHSYLSQNDVDVISWNIDIEDMTSPNLNYYQGSHKAIITFTSDLLKNMMEMEYYVGEDTDSMLPRCRNSCLSQKLYRKIVQKTGNLFMGYAPDYSGAFQILLSTQYMMYVDISLYSLVV